MTTKTKPRVTSKSKPAPVPAATPEPVKAATAEDLATQCDRCTALIDSLESQMAEIEAQHTQHEQAIEKMRSEQAIRHESYDALQRAIEEAEERTTSLKMSLVVTRETPSEAATQQMLEQHTRTLEKYKSELKELEELDLRRGESDGKSTAAHERQIAALEEQYAALQSQSEELYKQHETLYEDLGWTLYREYEASTEKLEWKLAQEDAERRGQAQAYEVSIAQLRRETISDLEDWPHIVWHLEAIQKNIDASRKDERHERSPMVALLRAHQAYLQALQQHGNACSRRRYGNYDLVQVLSFSQQLIGECLIKQVNLKPNIDIDNAIIEQHA